VLEPTAAAGAVLAVAAVMCFAFKVEAFLVGCDDSARTSDDDDDGEWPERGRRGGLDVAAPAGVLPSLSCVGRSLGVTSSSFCRLLSGLSSGRSGSSPVKRLSSHEVR
jgi:hypothetical protein